MGAAALGWKCSTLPQNPSENAGAALPAAAQGQEATEVGWNDKQGVPTFQGIAQECLGSVRSCWAEGQGHPGVGVGVWMCREGEP